MAASRAAAHSIPVAHNSNPAADTDKPTGVSIARTAPAAITISPRTIISHIPQRMPTERPCKRHTSDKDSTTIQAQIGAGSLTCYGVDEVNAKLIPARPRQANRWACIGRLFPDPSG
jgi:hypothetical protein